MTLTIHPDLRSLIPSLTPEEYAQLEANIVADGCRDPLIVWQEKQTLLDGHNRLQICERHGLTYAIHEVSLPDLDAVKLWMSRNQRGRRNLTPEHMSYLRGMEYEIQKRQGKRTDLTFHHSDGKSQSTAQVLANLYKVGTATIERDGAYARAIDAIVEVAGPEARRTLLARDTKMTQQEVKELADVASISPPTVQEVMASVQVAKTPKTVKQIVQLAVEAAQKQVATVGSGNLAEAGVSAATLARLAPKPAAPKATTAPRAPAVQETVLEQPLNGEVVPTAAAPPSLAALLTQATRSLENLSAHLQTLVLPDALDAHVDACVAFGKACIPVAHLLTEHPALLGALQDQLPVAAPPKRPAPKGKAAKKRAVVQRKAKV